jgi:thiol-disulfide isomerase/thioredoxin|tara:strand:- start:85 stop:834 length:750 start_codon:yes stop_codon:yes gene_type:complete
MVANPLSYNLKLGAEEKPPFEEVYKKMDSEVRAALKKDRSEGLKELERVGNLLSKDYPKEFMPYAMLHAFARMTPDKEKSLKILKGLAELDESDPKIAKVVSQARGELKKMEALGKPLKMKFTALDGREVDLSMMKGKVVLIDFWATWCGPCVREIPSVKKTYEELHSKGFEIIGISMDSDKGKLEDFLAKNDMSWPQFFDGKGWKTSLAQEHGISSIPAMWLVDKEGNLVDQNARSDLEEKVQKYLAM